MKKTLLIALFLGCLTSFASAGMKAGVTASGYQLDATGKESSLGGAADQSRSEDIAGATVSIFAEYSINDMFSVGVDIIPYDIDMGSVSNERIGNTKVVDTTNQTGTNTATVDMQHHTTAYLLVPSEQGIYLKAGLSYANLAISENMTTSSSYPDTEIFGGHINIGYEHDLGDFFVRGEIGYSQWQEVEVKSSSNRNTIKADLEGTSARISIGKAF